MANFAQTSALESVQTTESHKMEFCNWFLSKDEGFEKKYIFSDEKWIVLHPAPNSQKERIGHQKIPRKKSNADIKGIRRMFWAGLVDRRMLTVQWMIDDAGGPVSVTAERYLAMIKEDVWPEVRPRAAQLRYWWQQDGARPHTTDEVIISLTEKFRRCVLSRRFENDWPASSPDLKPLDVFLGLRDVTGEEIKTSNY